MVVVWFDVVDIGVMLKLIVSGVVFLGLIWLEVFNVIVDLCYLGSYLEIIW